MAWQLTTVLARAGKVLGTRRRWSSADAGAQAQALLDRRSSGSDGVGKRAFARVERALPSDERAAFAAATAPLDAAGSCAAKRVLAAGAPVRVAIAFARAWPTLGETERELACRPLGRDDAGPVAWGGTAARQIDSTTCGAATLAMMAMLGDPLLGLWVASGARIDGYAPPELSRISGRHTSIGARWAALQRGEHAAATRFGIGPFPWPRRFGTPPWRVNNTARFLGLRLVGAVVDDTDDPATQALIDHAAAAVLDGIPVPLYASGDSTRGIDTVLPRHVVLLTHRTDDGFLVYEPSSAALQPLTDKQMLDGGAQVKALGNWTHVSWMVLPRARSRAEQLAWGS